MTNEELESRVRAIENELAELRGWREAIGRRDDKTVAWAPVVVAVIAVLLSTLLPILLGVHP